MVEKIARFNSVNSEITARKLTKFGKKSTQPSSVHKELSYGEKIAKIGPVYPAYGVPSISLLCSSAFIGCVFLSALPSNWQF